MALSTAAKVAIGVGVLATAGFVGGGVARAAKKLRDARREPLPEPEHEWLDAGEYTSGDQLVSWRTYRVGATGEYGVAYFVGDIDQGSFCCHASGPEALERLFELWPSEPALDEAALAHEFGIQWSDTYQAIEDGFVPASDTLLDADVHWVLVQETEPQRYDVEYRVLYTVGGIPSTSYTLHPTSEQAIWQAMDAIQGPPWSSECFGGDAHETPGPYDRVWFCPSAQAGQTVSRGWVVVDDHPAEWRVQKTANPDAPYVAQHRVGLDPLDTEGRGWTFDGTTDFTTDAVAWAQNAAKEAA